MTTFYATAEQQACKGGAVALGLMEPTEKVKSGECTIPWEGSRVWVLQKEQWMQSLNRSNNESG